MDKACLDHLLSEEERLQFQNDGYLIVEDALPPEVCDRLEAAADRVDVEERPKRGLTQYDRLSVMDFIGRDDEFLEVIAWPTTFPKVFGLMGWGVQIYHSHLVYSPPEEKGKVSPTKRGWHQDSGRLNVEMEYSPRPMLSLKVCYFLSDCMNDGMANFRWIRPRDNMTVERYFDQVDPIRKQILGYNVSEKGYSSPLPEDVPLKTWMEENLASERLERWA